MGSKYLTDLADVVRSAGLTCHEEDGWQHRSRSSGGYDSGRPTHVMVHHTASGPSADGQDDVDYIAYESDIKPVSNLYLSRSGEVWVIAAGATNTNGSGHDWWGGGVPDDSMNVHAVAVEAGNDGVGERWPDAQQDAYLKLTGALCSHYGISPDHARAHAEWAPQRKIDPAGPSRFGVSNSSGTWNMDIFRDDVFTGPGPGPGPTPPPVDFGGSDVAYYKDDRQDGWQIWVQAVDKNGNAWTCPINDLPDGGKWHLVQPIVGDPPVRPFGAMIGLMDAQNRPG